MDKAVTGMFFDYSKSFDTVNIQFVTEIIECVKDINRVIFVKLKNKRVGGKTSTIHNVNLGVPQDSIICPLLSILFIDDLPEQILGILVNFSVGTLVALAVSSIVELLYIIESVNSNIMYDWSLKNGLILNKSKTKLSWEYSRCWLQIKLE